MKIFLSSLLLVFVLAARQVNATSSSYFAGARGFTTVFDTSFNTTTVLASISQAWQTATDSAMCKFLSYGFQTTMPEFDNIGQLTTDQKMSALEDVSAIHDTLQSAQEYFDSSPVSCDAIDLEYNRILETQHRLKNGIKCDGIYKEMERKVEIYTEYFQDPAHKPTVREFGLELSELVYDYRYENFCHQVHSVTKVYLIASFVRDEMLLQTPTREESNNDEPHNDEPSNDEPNNALPSNDEPSNKRPSNDDARPLPKTLTEFWNNLLVDLCHLSKMYGSELRHSLDAILSNVMGRFTELHHASLSHWYELSQLLYHYGNVLQEGFWFCARVVVACIATPFALVWSSAQAFYVIASHDPIAFFPVFSIPCLLYLLVRIFSRMIKEDREMVEQDKRKREQSRRRRPFRAIRKAYIQSLGNIRMAPKTHDWKLEKIGWLNKEYNWCLVEANLLYILESLDRDGQLVTQTFTPVIQAALKTALEFKKVAALKGDTDMPELNKLAVAHAMEYVVDPILFDPLVPNAPHTFGTFGTP